MKYQTEYMRKYQASPVHSDNEIELRSKSQPYMNEPTIQKKKRVPVVRSTIQLTDGYNSASPRQLTNHKSRIKQMSVDENDNLILNTLQRKERKQLDEYVLLGPQDKLSSNNIPYALRRPLNSKDFNQIENERNLKTDASTNTEMKAGVKTQTKNSPQKLKLPIKKRKTVKTHNDPQHSCGVQTEIQPVPAPVVHVDTGVNVNKNANETRMIRRIPMSEYQKSFAWVNQNDETRQSAPILDLKASKQNDTKTIPESNVNDNVGHQIFIPASIAEPVKPEKQQKRDPFHRLSEYKSSFIYRPTKTEMQPRLTREQLEIKKFNEAEDINHKHHLMFASNPEKPFGPHGNIRRWKSEYRSNFKPFWTFKDHKYDDMDKPELKSHENMKHEVSDWFKNIIELRRKAEEYKLRSYGANFSSDHMAQLISKNLDLWDVESKSSSNSNEQNRMGFEKCNHSNFNTQHSAPAGLPTKMQIRSHSAEPVVNRTKHDAQTNTIAQESQVKSKLTESTQTQVSQTKNALKLHEPPIVRLVHNLDSTQIQKHMIWDENENDNYSDAGYGSKELIDKQTETVKNSKQKSKTNKEIELPIHHHQDQHQNQHHLHHKSKKQQNEEKTQNSHHNHHHEHGHQHHHDHHYDKNKRELVNNYLEQYFIGKAPLINDSNGAHHNGYKHTHFDHRNHMDTAKPNNKRKNVPLIAAASTSSDNDFIDKDIDSLSEFSTRSLASCSSLLERAKENRHKFWSNDYKQMN